jgi:hypothetical protein
MSELSENMSWLISIPRSVAKRFIRTKTGLPDFQAKNPDLGNFFRVSQWKRLVYFMAIGSILQTFRIVDGHLVYWLVNWYICTCFGKYHLEKSGSPGRKEAEGCRLSLVFDNSRFPRFIWIQLNTAWGQCYDHVFTNLRHKMAFFFQTNFVIQLCKK